MCFSDNVTHKRRPFVAAFLIAYGAKFERIKNKNGCTLLQQELRTPSSENIILDTAVKAMSKVPSLHSLGLASGSPIGQMSLLMRSRLNWFKSIPTCPRTLQHHCRFTVRQCLGVKRLRHIEDLPLPATLKDYLLLEVNLHIT